MGGERLIIPTLLGIVLGSHYKLFIKQPHFAICAICNVIRSQLAQPDKSRLAAKPLSEITHTVTHTSP